MHGLNYKLWGEKLQTRQQACISMIDAKPLIKKVVQAAAQEQIEGEKSVLTKHNAKKTLV